MDYILPIGSVVRLKDGEKRLMIYGIKQVDQESTDTVYDYLGVLYPEGHIGEEYQYLFNHEDIENIYFRGFMDIEGQEFFNRLDEALKEKNEK